MASTKKIDLYDNQRTIQVVDHIRELIENGTLRPGDKIPAEREFSSSLKISRASLRSGIGYLVAMGVLKARHGVGTFVSDEPPAFGKASVNLMGALYGFQVWQMYEARLILEGNLASLAAERAQQQHLIELADEVTELFASLDKPTEFLIHDVIFHRILAKASGNPVLAALMETLSTAVYEGRSRTVERASDMRQAAEMHHLICKAVCAHDADEARFLMEKHLKDSQKAQAREQSKSKSRAKKNVSTAKRAVRRKFK